MSRKRSNDDIGASISSKKRHVDNNRNSIVPSQSNTVSQPISAQQWARSGKLLKIHLTNFMCHSNLVMEFSNRINFLAGSNGSGKSAILTALIIGLGAKAIKTNRSTTLKNLIKTGESSATIEIVIANIEPDAYDVETYGKSITVERKIFLSGSSVYKVKDERGHVVSKSLDELKKILLYHNIQTDNPVFVLNQDAARTFLKEMDPFKNYQLFLKATQIEIVLEKLHKCEHMSKDYKFKLTCSKKQTDILENEVQELSGKYERLQSVETIKENIKQNQLELDWVRVRDQEIVVQNIKKQLDDVLKEIDLINKKMNNKDTVHQEILVQINDLGKDWENINSLVRKENIKLRELQAQLKTENERYEIDQNSRRKLEERIVHFEKQKSILETEITKRTEEGSSREQRMREENELKIKNLVKNQTELTAMIASVKQDLYVLQHTKDTQNEEEEQLQVKRGHIESIINRNTDELQRIAQSPKDSVAVYGQHLHSLLSAIDRAHKSGKFSDKPKGPVGRYIEVSDKKWRGTVEQLILPLLSCFVVSNARDRSVLDNIIKTQFPEAKHAIITMKFLNRAYDVSRGAVAKLDGAHRLMDLIKCSDPDIVNCLIDRCRIETVVLVEDQNLAMDLTSEESRVPKNLKRVILLKPFLEYNPAPKYRAYSLQQRPPRFIQVNMKERQMQLKNDIRQKEVEKREIENNLRKLRLTIEQYVDHQREKQTLLRKHENTLNHISRQLDEAYSVEIPSENELEVLQKELTEITSNLESIQIRIDKSEQTCLQSQQLYMEKDKDVRKCLDKIQQMEEELNNLMSEQNDKKLELNTLNNDARSWSVALAKSNSNMGRFQTEYKKQCKQLKVVEEFAKRNNVERIESEKTEEDITNSIKNMEIKVNKICSAADNIEDIKALLDDRCMKLEKNKLYVETISDALNALKKSRILRFTIIKRLQEHMALRVTYTFKHILQIRNYVGELQIDHIKKTLSVSIIPRDNHISNAVSSTKSLSGGERSYSTVALLLSLWSCVDHPFYFLDEYDVFTDQYNREIITKLLLNEGQRKSHRQYTFLTPQDLSFVTANDIVKIHRLFDPER